MSAKARLIAGAIAFMAVTGDTGPVLVSRAIADGAFAVGSTGNAKRDGTAYGGAVEYKSAEEARAKAVESCKARQNAPKAAAQCRVINNFKGQCWVVAEDPKVGTPGTGWAIADTLVSAKERALANCEATAGSSRRGYCAVEAANCDGDYDPDTDRAIANYTELSKLNLNTASAYRRRGNAYQKKNDYARAALDYDEVTRINSQDADAWNQRCWARAIAGQLDQALKDCNESLRLRPNDANTLDSRGLVYLKLSNLDKAIDDYDAVVKLNPKAAGSLYGRGIAKQKKGDRAGGKADIVAAKAARPEIAELFVRYGVATVDGISAPVPTSTPTAVHTSSPTQVPATDCAQAETHWKSAEDIKTLSVYQDHLARFPTCNFSALARARIEALKK